MGQEYRNEKGDIETEIFGCLANGTYLGNVGGAELHLMGDSEKDFSVSVQRNGKRHAYGFDSLNILAIAYRRALDAIPQQIVSSFAPPNPYCGENSVEISPQARASAAAMRETFASFIAQRPRYQNNSFNSTLVYLGQVGECDLYFEEFDDEEDGSCHHYIARRGNSDDETEGWIFPKQGINVGLPVELVESIERANIYMSLRDNAM